METETEVKLAKIDFDTADNEPQKEPQLGCCPCSYFCSCSSVRRRVLVVVIVVVVVVVFSLDL